MAEPSCDVIESHYLETGEGLFFAVKGLVHPLDRFLAILRYVPDPGGERQKNGQRYRRLYHFAEQEQLLRARYPQYLAFDPVCQATLQSVPRSCVRRIYDPRRRLQEIRQQPERDPVEDDALAFASFLQHEAHIPWASLGISGSLLIGLHTPYSDLDITVYGAQNCRAVQRALQQALAAGTGSGISRLDRQGVADLYVERVADTRMAFTDFVQVEQGKVNQGQFRGRLYFIRFVKEPAEVEERYGDYQYTPLGRVGIAATVTDAGESLFTPCSYLLEGVRLLHGPSAGRVAITPVGTGLNPVPTEIVSFRARFSEQAQAGDRVQAWGTVERVQARDGRVWHRLLLGNHPEDTMVLQR